MNRDQDSEPGLFTSAKHLLATFVSATKTRLELVAVDIELERSRVVRQLLLAVAAVLLAGIGIILLTLLIVVAVWDTPARLPVLGALTALYWIGVACCGYALRKRTQAPGQLFKATVEELGKDLESLTSRK